MLKELIDKLKKKKEKLETFSNVHSEKTHEIEKPNFEINILNQNNIYKLEISDYISLQDYRDRMDLIDKDNVADLIFMSVLYNSEKSSVNSGTYFVFQKENKLYNIMINERQINIAERALLGEEKEEKILQFLVDGSDYNYFRCKHDKMGSSYATKYYAKKGTSMPKLELTKEEFVDDINTIIGALNDIDYIKEIYDVNTINDVISDNYGKTK